MRKCLRLHPVLEERWVNAVLKRFVSRLQLLVAQCLTRRRAAVTKMRHAVNGIDCQAEPVRLVANGKGQLA